MVTGFALDNLQLRGELFVGPGDVCYEGMVVGETSRPGDMVVNAVRAKEKTNIRTHSHDEAVKLAPPVVHTLETAIEWIADDELVEVTPDAIRIRKRLLAENDRRRATGAPDDDHRSTALGEGGYRTADPVPSRFRSDAPPGGGGTSACPAA